MFATPMRFAMALLCVRCQAAAPTGPQFHSNCGPVQGVWEGDGSGRIAAFRGIPYGQPPVGDLRWKPPLPAKCWHGTLNATSNGHICHQMNHNSHLHQNEDCLVSAQ